MERLGVSLSTVDRYIRDGKLKTVRLSSRTTRITEASLEALAAGQTAPVEDTTALLEEYKLPQVATRYFVIDIRLARPAGPPDGYATQRAARNDFPQRSRYHVNVEATIIPSDGAAAPSEDAA